MLPRTSAFLDTSVLFAAVLSPAGGSRMLLKLGELGVLSLWVGNSVLREADEVVRRKAPGSLPLLALLLERSRISIGEAPSAQDVAAARAATGYSPDVLVLSEALAVGPHWFVTLNRKHFLGNPGIAALPFRLGVPRDLLAFLRDEGLVGQHDLG